MGDAATRTGCLTPQDHRFLDELVKLDDANLAVDILMSRQAPRTGHNAPEEAGYRSCSYEHSGPTARHRKMENAEFDESRFLSPPVPVESHPGAAL